MCSLRVERHSLHCGSEQVGGGDVKGGGEGREEGGGVGGLYSLDAKASGLEWRWGRGGTCCPATHLPASALLSLRDPFLTSLSRSLFPSLGCEQVVRPSATTVSPVCLLEAGCF